MRHSHFMITSIIITIMIIGCNDKNLAPVEPIDQNSAVSLNKKGSIVHRIEGSALGTFEGKTFGGRITAHEYNDGSFGGDIKINAVQFNTDLNINIDVISFKVYESVGEYGGKMGVLLGQAKTGEWSGTYFYVLVIDNGKPGQTTAPDQFRMWGGYPSLDYVIDDEDFFIGLRFLEIYDLSPEVLLSNLGILDCNKGNITVE